MGIAIGGALTAPTQTLEDTSDSKSDTKQKSSSGGITLGKRAFS
jgi:hypothetical protein